MSYIGRGVDAISNVEKLDNITFNGGTTYALTKSSAAFTPVGANNILISIDGVIQQGNFSVSTTNIVFDWSPTSSNTCDFILHYGVGLVNTLGDQVITSANMGANSVDSASYVDGSIDGVHLADDVISAQTELAVAPADADEFMVSDGGVLKRIDYSLIKGGDNTPAFQAGLSSSQSITNDTYVKITCDTEVFDTDGTYDNTTNYRWTPAVVGKYYVYCLTRFLTATDFDNFYIVIYKNGAIHFLRNMRNTNYDSQFISGIVDCDADDYFEAFVYQTTAGAQDIIGEVRQTYFGGFKIIT